MVTKYEINVAYEGKHDHVITVDKNGPDDVSQMTARAVMRAMRYHYGEGYEFTLTRIRKVELHERI